MMGRRAKFNAVEVDEIRKSGKTQGEEAKERGASVLTILKVRNFQGAYKQEVFDLTDEFGRLPDNV